MYFYYSSSEFRITRDIAFIFFEFDESLNYTRYFLRFIRSIRLFMILPGIFWALRLGALPDYRPILAFEEIVKYRTRNTKTFEEWLEN